MSRGGARIKVKLSFQSVRRVLQGAWNLCRTQAPQLSSRASRHTEQVPSSQGSPRTSWLPSFSPVCPCGCALPSPTVYTRFLLKWVGEGSYCLLLKNPISENTLLRLAWLRQDKEQRPTVTFLFAVLRSWQGSSPTPYCLWKPPQRFGILWGPVLLVDFIVILGVVLSSSRFPRRLGFPRSGPAAADPWHLAVDTNPSGPPSLCRRAQGLCRHRLSLRVCRLDLQDFPSLY